MAGSDKSVPGDSFRLGERICGRLSANILEALAWFRFRIVYSEGGNERVNQPYH